MKFSVIDFPFFFAACVRYVINFFVQNNIDNEELWRLCVCVHYFAILPGIDKSSLDNYCKSNECKPVSKSFSYDSGTNEDFLSVEQIRHLIRENVNSKFKI